MNFSTPPLSFPSATGSITILVSHRECQASLLLLFTGYSITLSTSGRLIFLKTHLPQSPLAPYLQGIYHMKIWNYLACFTSLVLELGLVKHCNICTAVKFEHKNSAEYCEIYTLS